MLSDQALKFDAEEETSGPTTSSDVSQKDMRWARRYDYQRAKCKNPKQVPLLFSRTQQCKKEGNGNQNKRAAQILVLIPHVVQILGSRPPCHNGVVAVNVHAPDERPWYP